MATFVYFWVSEAARELTFIDCEIYTNNLYIETTAYYGDGDTLFSLQFHKTLLSTPASSLPLNFVIDNTKENSFIFIKMTSLTLSNVAFQGHNVQGYLGVCIENVIWINRETFMDLNKVVSVNIVSSQLILNCDTCAAMIIDGLKCPLHSLMEHFYEGITGTSCLYYSDISITETTFEIHVSMPDKIVTENTDIFLKYSTFIIEGSISFKAKHFEFIANSLIQCPTGEMPQRAVSLSNVIYTCKLICEGSNKFSLQAGMLGVSKQASIDGSSSLQTHSLSLAPYPPTCLPCPLGAKCEGPIQALPDYWGYVTQMNKSVSMIRCPDSYCCQGNETCKAIDSCNTGRTGTLCATCERDLTEALFTTKCLPNEDCRSDLVIVILISAVLVYGIVLLSFSTIKDMVMKLFKKGYIRCKERFRQGKVNRNSSDEQQSKEDTATEENDLKYMQLLFYYVQDSKLFTVHFPETDTKTENIVVKFLEFSPDILRAYIQVSELCFVFSTATMKVFLSLSFGFLVMTFLFFVYCIQKITSHIVQRKSHFVTLEIKLVKAFLVTVLLSYQKLVMGALMLVQCIDISRQSNAICSS